ncbi:hypothetical protein HDU97_007506 [Phlyctochytrium planicorne]|nr:hypothetical protein HDU97_007506 [Phlyctochytrium planicorne]
MLILSSIKMNCFKETDFPSQSLKKDTDNFSSSSYGDIAPKSSISTGVIGGIVVAVTFAALGAILAFILVRRRKAASKGKLQSALTEPDNSCVGNEDLIEKVKQANTRDGRDISPHQNDVIDSHTNAADKVVTSKNLKQSEENELAIAQSVQITVRKQVASELFAGHSSPNTSTSPTSLKFNQRVSSITPPFHKRDSSIMPRSQQLLTQKKSGFPAEPIPPPSVVSEDEPIRSLSIKLEFPDANTLRSQSPQILVASIPGINEGDTRKMPL